MPLEDYSKKRNFKNSPEPPASSNELQENGRAQKYAGAPGSKSAEDLAVANNNLKFVIHKHYASHLHFDLRLELDGVLKSWAIPKGPTVNPKEKKLAVMVEDHPFEYRDFEGIIPEGNYGAGRVYIWDQGTYHALGTENRDESEKLLREGLEKGHLTFILNGNVLKGEFALIRLKKASPKDWLLIKKNDEYASDMDVAKLEAPDEASSHEENSMPKKKL
jgi:bifunctional non-homologous end joining protein LigD